MPRLRFFAFIVLCAAALPATAAAQYTTRFTTIANGAITFTGNSLGLDGADDQNGQGTRGSIGTFITTNTALQDATPPPAGSPPFPAGTTADWRQNAAAATLRLPAGARVLHAELVWGGSWAYGGENVGPFLNEPVTLTTPSGSFPISPDPATARTTGAAGATGNCRPGPSCFYTRTADVTSLVQQAGVFVVGGVPGTQATGQDSNYTGWTLAVVYQDFDQPIRSLSLFLGQEPSGGAAAAVTGFCTPPSGPLAGRLAVSATEGDARLTGDEMRFGPTGTLTAAHRVDGQRNPPTNFFAGQVADDEGNLDTAGTFGTLNHTPGSAAVGARQGWDITNVDVSARLVNNQTTAFAQGTTSGDGYRITTLALQIDIGAPGFGSAGGEFTVDRATAALGDVLTYTVLIDNSAGTTNANNVVLFDTPAAGTTLVPGSVVVNGVPQPGANLLAGLPLGTMAVGQVTTVTFQAQVTSIPSGPSPHLRSNQARWTFDFVSCAGQPAQTGSAETNFATTIVPTADLAIAKTLLNPPAVAGGPVRYQIVVTNNGPSAVDGALVTDPGSSPALSGVTWSCGPISQGAMCPPTGTGPLNAVVQLAPATSVRFIVSGTLAPTTAAATALSNTASVSAPPGVPDANAANNTATLSVSTTASADVRLAKVGPATGQRGTDIAYTVTVVNDGPSAAQNVLVTDPAPDGLTLVSLTGACATAPGCQLGLGASDTVIATFTIPAAYAGPDPIVNTATATSATPDPLPANNSTRATTALDAPSVDVTVAKTNGVTEVAAGTQTGYTINVSNAGPAAALQSRLVDQFDPATFSTVSWQCQAGGTSRCGVAAGTGNVDILVDIDPGPGNAVVITAQAAVRPDATGTANNTATVTVAAGVSDRDLSNNTAADSDRVARVADISLVKTGPPTITPGTTVEYTIAASNAGPSAVRDFSFIELPEEGAGGLLEGTLRPELVETVVAPPDSPCAILPGDASPSCTIPFLGPGEARVFTVRLKMPADFRSTQTSGAPAITNNAVLLLAGIDDDPDSDDLTGRATSLITPQADVAVTKIGPRSVVAGATASYFIRVSNGGPSTATNIVVEDPLPANVIVESSAGPCAAGFPCTIPTLAPGEGVTTRVDLHVPQNYTAPPTFVNTATVRNDVPDPVAANNSASISTLVVPEQADLQLEKFGPTIVAPGGLMEHTARVTNLGPGPAIDVTFADVIPAGTVLTGTTPPGPPTVCTIPTTGTTNLVSCLTPVLPVGGVLEFRFTAVASPDLLPGSFITKVGIASSPTPDLNPVNDRGVVVTRVAAPTEAELIVAQIDSPDPAIAGTDVTYVITVRSVGPAAATNVTLTDTIPAGLTLVSAAASQGSCVDATCALGTLTPGTAATVTIVAATTSPGVFTNIARATATEPDPILGNNTARETTTVAMADQADLVIEKIGPDVMHPGDSSYYSIRVTNRGPAAAMNVRVLDPLAPGVTFIGNSKDCETAFPCDFDVLEPGQVVEIATAFTVPPDVPAPTVISTTAEVVSSASTDPSPSDNRSQTSTNVRVRPSADLVVLKTDSPDAVVAGAPLSYAITVANRGPGVANDVTLTDVVPPGVAVISARSSQGTCAVAETIVCQLGTMPNGSSAEIGILATAPPVVPIPNPMVNTASVSFTGATDPTPTNARTAHSTTVAGVADVQIVKTGPVTTIPGGRLSYQLTIANVGQNPAANVTVTDPTPGGLTFVSISGACTTPFPCLLGTLGAGETRTILAEYDVAATATSGTTIVNVATVGTTTIERNPANDSSTAMTTVMISSDIALTKSVDRPTAQVGETVVFTVTALNRGPSASTGLEVLDVPAPGLAITSVVASQGTFDARTGMWAVGPLAAGASGTLTLTAQIVRAGPQVNQVTRLVADQADPDSSNDTAAATIAATPVADVRVRKTVDRSQVNVGDTVNFAVTVENAGPSPATGIAVVDLLPPGLAFVSAAAGAGAYDAMTGGWQIGTLDAGASTTLLLSATVSEAGELTNTARKVSATELDPVPANDMSGATVMGLSSDVQVLKTVSTRTPGVATVGERIQYVVRAMNRGPSSASGLRVRDVLPAGLVFAGATATQGVFVPEPGIWDVGTLAAAGPGSLATLTIDADVTQAAELVNTATRLSSNEIDPNALNDASTVRVSALTADFSVTLSASGTPGVAGSALDLEAVATNIGSGTITGPVTMTFTLPTETAYESAPDGWTCTPLASTVSCARSDLTVAPGAAARLAIRARVMVPIEARWVYASVANPGDANTVNNTAGVELLTPSPVATDVSVALAVAPAEVQVDGEARITATLINAGPGSAPDTVLTVVLPAGVALVSIDSSGIVCVGTTSVACQVGDLNVGASALVTLVVRAVSLGLHPVSASASTSLAEPDLGNNSAVGSLLVRSIGDGDGDGVSDTCESQFGLDLRANDAAADPDADGISNLAECLAGTHPNGIHRSYFAEGAAGGTFFDTAFLLANHNPTRSTSASVRLLREDGTAVTQALVLPAGGHARVDARAMLGDAPQIFSAIIESDRPLSPSRLMTWNADGYGSHAERGIDRPAVKWYVAEGATTEFALFYLILNPGPTEATIAVDYLPATGPSVTRLYTVGPSQRFTIYVNQVPGLEHTDVSAVFTSQNGVPIVVERAMYRDSPARFFEAGHAGAAIDAAATVWHLAEGATGDFFDTFVLVANPGDTDAEIEARFRPSSGVVVSKRYTVAPRSRFTIYVDAADPALAATDVATTIVSTNGAPVVVERAMWWPGLPAATALAAPVWYESHVVAASPMTAPRWTFADGAQGGPLGFETFVLVSNTSSIAGLVQVQLLLGDGTILARNFPMVADGRLTVPIGVAFPEAAGRQFGIVVANAGSPPLALVVERAMYATAGGLLWTAGSAMLGTPWSAAPP